MFAQGDFLSLFSCTASNIALSCGPQCSAEAPLLLITKLLTKAVSVQIKVCVCSIAVKFDASVTSFGLAACMRLSCKA